MLLAATGLAAYFLRGRQLMRASKSFVAVSSVLALGCGVLFTAAPASAYVACNSSGDCWHTGSKMKWSGAIVSYHEDDWWDAHKADAQYHWHDADAEHNWQHGFWANGVWNGGL
jgi:hypothetical protein